MYGIEIYMGGILYFGFLNGVYRVEMIIDGLRIFGFFCVLSSFCRSFYSVLQNLVILLPYHYSAH